MGLDSEVVSGSILVAVARKPTLFSTPGMFIPACARAETTVNPSQRQLVSSVPRLSGRRIGNSRDQLAGCDVRHDFHVFGVEQLDAMERYPVRRSNVHIAAIDALCFRNQVMNDF